MLALLRTVAGELCFVLDLLGPRPMALAYLLMGHYLVQLS